VTVIASHSINRNQLASKGLYFRYNTSQILHYNAMELARARARYLQHKKVTAILKAWSRRQYHSCFRRMMG